MKEHDHVSPQYSKCRPFIPPLNKIDLQTNNSSPHFIHQTLWYAKITIFMSSRGLLPVALPPCGGSH